MNDLDQESIIKPNTTIKAEGYRYFGQVVFHSYITQTIYVYDRSVSNDRNYYLKIDFRCMT